MNDFFSRIIELVFNQESFSDALYDYNLYNDLGWYLIITGLLLTVLFYYVLNSARFCKRIHWLIVYLIFVVSTFGYIFLYVFPVLKEADYSFPITYYFSLSIITSCLAFIVLLLLSAVLHWWSTNCKYTPFKK